MSIALAVLLFLPTAPQPSAAETVIAQVLDAWHAAAAAADEEKYFSFLAPDAVFLGTDPSERWTRDEFRRYAHPYFAKGSAWSFKPVRRRVFFAPDGRTAWFDEELETPNLGPSRGTGVLLAQADGWKIVQYNLSVPIPNALMKEVKERIEKAEPRSP